MLHVKNDIKNFTKGDFSLEDESRTGRPQKKIETDKLQEYKL